MRFYGWLRAQLSGSLGKTNREQTLINANTKALSFVYIRVDIVVPASAGIFARLAPAILRRPQVVSALQTVDHLAGLL